MKFLGGYTYFGSQTEFASVGKAGRGINIDCGSVYRPLKIKAFCFISGYYAFAVSCAVFADMLYGILCAVHYPGSYYVIIVFFAPVVFPGSYGLGYHGQYLFVAPYLHPCCQELFGYKGQGLGSSIFMDKHTFAGIADRGARNLGIIYDICSHLRISGSCTATPGPGF